VPASSWPPGSTVEKCGHLAPVVPDVAGPHPVEMAGVAHGIDHRLVQRVDVGEHLIEAPAVGRRRRRPQQVVPIAVAPVFGYHADEGDGGDPGVEGRDRDRADAVIGRVECDQPGLRVLLLQVLQSSGPPSAPHPRGRGTNGRCGRGRRGPPGHHVLVEVAPGLEHCREAQPARRCARRARVAPGEALLAPGTDPCRCPRTAAPARWGGHGPRG
jgi:hypothetical protein